MSETVKLIVKIPKETYLEIKEGSLTRNAMASAEIIQNGIPLESIKEKILEFLKCPEYENCDWKNCFDCNKSRCINLNNVDRLMSVIEADKKERGE